ncbi:hypothetical protein ABW20_dc0104693 [Dactylellina cionopaga]|nr:hypothetical protein ABW20_dc0104693 [Dactylellina cionopaga]
MRSILVAFTAVTFALTALAAPHPVGIESVYGLEKRGKPKPLPAKPAAPVKKPAAPVKKPAAPVKKPAAPAKPAAKAAAPPKPIPAFVPDTTNFTPWKYVGCYGSEAGVSWDAKLCSCVNAKWKGAASGMPWTMQKCFAACKGAGFRYAGIKGAPGAKHCWCGSGVSDADKLGSEEKCNVPCAGAEGDKAKGYNFDKCGSATSWSIWKDPCYTTYDPDDSAANYQYVGCFWYSGYGEILPEKGASVSGDNLSIDGCLQLCSSKGYAYAGMSATPIGKPPWPRGDQCWCGGRIGGKFLDRHKSAAGAADTGKCNVLCSATAKIKKSIKPEEYQFCGGNWFMSMWRNADLDLPEVCGETR